MDHPQAQFLPFNAINEFMRDDYRLEVIRETLNGIQQLSSEKKDMLEKITKKSVQVPGFRHSTKAPVNLRLKPTLSAFEKDPMVSAVILSAWSELRQELRQNVYDLLVERKWEILPPDIDRSKLPGFLTKWPKGEDFEALILGFRERFPAGETKDDDISLMSVWISGRLPYSADDEVEPG